MASRSTFERFANQHGSGFGHYFAETADNAPVNLMTEGQEPQAEEQEPEQEPESISEKMLFESLDENLLTEAVSAGAEITLRSNAMASILAFADEGMTTADELDAFAVGIADADDDGEVTDPEQEDYEEALNAIADALEHVGVEPELIEKALGDDDDAAEQVAMHIANYADELDDEDQFIANYSVREKIMTEALRKVVRDGKVKWIKKPLRKRRMSAAQKAALRKARRKANTGAAKRARRKSMNLRKKAIK